MLRTGFSLVAASGGYSLLWRAGFSLWWLLLLRSTGSRCAGFSSCGAQASVVVACGLGSCGLWALECSLSSCGTRAYLLHGMKNLPRPGLEPVSTALAGGFLTTAPPGKPCNIFLLRTNHFKLCSGVVIMDVRKYQQSLTDKSFQVFFLILRNATNPCLKVTRIPFYPHSQ